MSEKKLLDLAKSARDEMGDLALSEVLPGIVKTYGDILYLIPLQILQEN